MKKMIRDCAYVATAKLKGASHIYTFDDKFIEKFSSGDEGVTVCWPSAEARLF